MFQYLSTLLREPLSFFDQAIFRILAVLIGLTCHEFGHAYVAHRCGDDTAKIMGRMTLNPLRHLDPFGALLMFFVGFGYAKPVPVNPRNYRGNKLRADMMVSLAGITVNLVLFILFTYLSALCSYFMWKPEVIREYGLTTLIRYRYNPVWVLISGQAHELFGPLIAHSWMVPFVRLFAYTALVNLNLAVFNLIPIPPLDGYHVFNDLIFKGKIKLSQMGFRIAMMIVLILSAQGILGRIISAVVYPCQQVLLWPLAAVWG